MLVSSVTQWQFTFSSLFGVPKRDISETISDESEYSNVTDMLRMDTLICLSDQEISGSELVVYSYFYVYAKTEKLNVVWF